MYCQIKQLKKTIEEDVEFAFAKAMIESRNNKIDFDAAKAHAIKNYLEELNNRITLHAVFHLFFFVS